jgi:hypothetical protein
VDLGLKEVGRFLLLEVLKLWLIFGLVGDHSLFLYHGRNLESFHGVSRPFLELRRLVNKAS